VLAARPRLKPGPDGVSLLKQAARWTGEWSARSGDQTAEERLSSQPTQSRLIDTLAHHRGNREAVRNALGDWLNRWVRATGTDRRLRQATIDIDSFPLEVFGRQEGRAYNGYPCDTVSGW
jgi:hypothetical protein